MIISASRRTDIPSYYSEWMLNRLKEKYVLVRNPMNIHQISKIDLSPNVVDAIVFWTKNPTPMLGRLDELKDYIYYFQFTLTAYGPDVERNLPLQIPLHRITDSASNGSVFPVVTEHFSASSDHAFL